MGGVRLLLAVLARVSVLCFAVLMTACVNIPSNTAEQRYVLNGRFAVTYMQQATQVREQGGFEWHLANLPHQITAQSAMTLLLKSPLGNTLAVLQYDPLALPQKQAHLNTPQTQFYDSDLDGLMNQVLGWSLPLQTFLPYVFSVPTLQSNLAQNSELLQGWQIEVVSRYDSMQAKLVTVVNEQRQIQARWVFDEFKP